MRDARSDISQAVPSSNARERFSARGRPLMLEGGARGLLTSRFRYLMKASRDCRAAMHRSAFLPRWPAIAGYFRRLFQIKHFFIAAFATPHFAARDSAWKSRQHRLSDFRRHAYFKILTFRDTITYWPNFSRMKLPMKERNIVGRPCYYHPLFAYISRILADGERSFQNLFLFPSTPRSYRVAFSRMISILASMPMSRDRCAIFRRRDRARRFRRLIAADDFVERQFESCQPSPE